MNSKNSKDFEKIANPFALGTGAIRYGLSKGGGILDDIIGAIGSKAPGFADDALMAVENMVHKQMGKPTSLWDPRSLWDATKAGVGNAVGAAQMAGGYRGVASEALGQKLLQHSNPALRQYAQKTMPGLKTWGQMGWGGRAMTGATMAQLPVAGYGVAGAVKDVAQGKTDIGTGLVRGLSSGMMLSPISTIGAQVVAPMALEFGGSKLTGGIAKKMGFKPTPPQSLKRPSGSTQSNFFQPQQGHPGSGINPQPVFQPYQYKAASDLLLEKAFPSLFKVPLIK